MADEDTLNDILETLEDIKAILLLANSVTIETARNELLKSGTEQAKIYELCDGKTTEEIMTITKKPQEYVNTNIRRLRKKGFIKTVERNGKNVHEQRF